MEHAKCKSGPTTGQRSTNKYFLHPFRREPAFSLPGKPAKFPKLKPAKKTLEEEKKEEEEQPKAAVEGTGDQQWKACCLVYNSHRNNKQRYNLFMIVCKRILESDFQK